MRGAKRMAFDAFDQSQRPSQLNMRGVKRSTLYRYYQEWKKLKGSSTSLLGAAISPTGQSSRPEEGGILSRYEEFLRLQNLDTRKAKVLERAEALKASLREADEEYLGQGVQINGWQRRRQLYEGRVGWVIREIDAARSEGALADLEALLERANGEISALRQELMLKLDEKEQLRRKREVELSCNLLRGGLDVPLFPAYVRKAVERRLLVRNEQLSCQEHGPMI